MSEINLHNYEAYLLDFMEGNLSAEDAKALQDFLESHPEIDADIFDMEDVKLSPENISFENKASLKRDDNMPEISKQDALLIGLLENQLSKEEKIAAETLIRENADAAKDFELYKKTKLSANTAIIYQDKENLKRKTRIIPMFAARYAAVAAVFVGILVTVFLNINTQPELNDLPDQIASTDNTIHFDADVNNQTETNITNAQTDNNSTETQLAAVTPIVEPVIENTHTASIETEPEIYTAIHLQPMPDRYASKINPERNLASSEIAFREPEHKKLNWKDMNITYIKETPMADNSEALKFPKTRDELDETIEELDKRYNPIIKLREAKEELFASNVEDLFKRNDK